MLLLIAAGWSFAEAILLFIVADVPISFIALRWGWGAGVKAALVASLAAAVGGAVTYAWANADPETARAAILALPAIDAALADTAAGRLAEGNFAMLWGSISGVPYKLYALAAGSEGRSLLPFLLLTPLVRLPRFIGAALLSAGISAALAPRVGLRARLAMLGLVWALFYAWYFWTMPG